MKLSSFFSNLSMSKRHSSNLPRPQAPGSEIVIRVPKLDDIDDVKNLIGQLGYFPKISDLEKALKLYIESDAYGVYVAELDSKIVGLICYTLTKILVSGKTRLHIEGLVVDSEYRRQGIAKRLLEKVESIASSIGSVVIDLVSGVRRIPEGAHEFYKAMGYELKGNDRKIYFRKG